MIPYLIQKQGIKDKYIGHAASIYRTCCIYMSDVSHLYIQRHRHIDAKRTEKRKTFKTSNTDDLTHTPKIPDAPFSRQNPSEVPQIASGSI